MLLVKFRAVMGSEMVVKRCEDDDSEQSMRWRALYVHSRGDTMAILFGDLRLRRRESVSKVSLYCRYSACSQFSVIDICRCCHSNYNQKSSIFSGNVASDKRTVAIA